MKITHLTAHLGGGVGNALAVLCEGSAHSTERIQRRIVCLEPPAKRQFYDRILASGVPIVIAPDLTHLKGIIATSDIVQLEWWNHPVTIKTLCSLGIIDIRLVVWSHVSGIYNPIIPPRLIDAATIFVTSTPAAPDRQPRADLPAAIGPIEFISSGGGFEFFPPLPQRDGSTPTCAFGYIGTTNFTKLAPDFIDLLCAVPDPDFTVQIIGDEINREHLVAQSRANGKADLLNFLGYREDILSEMSRLDVLLYPLNPRHYGTAEIVLLEAMAMGVVPIVLDNLIERNIVQHGVTGFVVRSRKEFAEAVCTLKASASLRQRLGENAATQIRGEYTRARMIERFQQVYSRALACPRKPFTFDAIFGATPSEWFLSCQRDPTFYYNINQDGITNNPLLRLELMEVTKGSISQFSSYFSDDQLLRQWCKTIRRLLCPSAELVCLS